MTLRHTPLFECHQRAGAKFTEFGGWEMPVQYSGLVDEHKAVRSEVGIFDVSHMGEMWVTGPKAFQFLQYVTTNDLSKIGPGKAQYTMLLNENGGVVDDIIVYQLSPERFLLCINAGNTAKDVAWLNKMNTIGAELEDVSTSFAQVAVQGPKAFQVVADVLGVKRDTLTEEEFSSFSVKEFTTASSFLSGKKVILARTGYTGEDGFEIFCAAADGAALWDALLAAGKPFGIKPCGLGARDTLRLEATFPLHGHEITDDITPLEAGFSWVVKLQKGDFIGKSALLRQKEAGLKRKLVGLEVTGAGIVREGSAVFKPGSMEQVGFTTSGTKPPTVGKAIALALVPPELTALGTTLEVNVREKRLPVRVIPLPFYKRPSIKEQAIKEQISK